MENNEQESEPNETRNEDKDRFVKKPESISSDVNVPSDKFWKIFSLISGIASLISIPLAFLFWLEAKQYPDANFTVHPVKAILLQKGQTSKLTASFDNKLIETDVSTAQMAIWNKGKKPVRKEAILSENNSIEIISVNRIPILEARIRKSSRDEVQCQLNNERMGEGVISLSWRILEQNDSCVIQVIYAGNTDENFTSIGTIEEQKGIKLFIPSDEKTPIQSLFNILSVLLYGITIFSLFEAKHRIGKKRALLFFIFFLVGVLSIVLFSIYSDSLTKDTLPFIFDTL